MQATSSLPMTHELQGFFPTLPLDNTAVEGRSTSPGSQEENWQRKGAFRPAPRQAPQQPTATGRENSLSRDCQFTPLTWDGDDRARVMEQLKDLSKWPDHLSTYPGVLAFHSFPQPCREGPRPLGCGVALSHRLVTKGCCGIGRNAHCHWRARTSRFVLSAVGAGWASSGVPQVPAISVGYQGAGAAG